jgi:two-component system response regulator YesN
MHHVLIVEDEFIQRRVLAGIVRKHQPECCVYEAANGKAALDVMNKHDIDIIVTDIKMPLMDGLTFIEEIHQACPAAKVIILSGYRNFEYAQRALRLGAFDYLVKPIKEEHVTKVLDNAIEALQKTASLQDEKVMLEKQLKDTLPVYQNHLFNKWVKGLATREELTQLHPEDLLPDSGYILALEWLVPELESVGPSWEEARKHLVKQMRIFLKETGNPGIGFWDLENDKIMYAVLGTNDAVPSERIYTLLRQLISTVKKGSYICSCAGVSNFSESLLDRGQEACEEALFAIAYTFYLDTNRIMTFSDMPSMVPDVALDFDKEEESLKDAIRQGDLDLLEFKLENLLASLLQKGFIIPDQLKRILVLLSLNAVATKRGFIEEAMYNEFVTQIERDARQAKTITELKSIILSGLQEMVEQVRQIKSRKHEVVVEKCMKYIDEHYMEDLHQESLASVFHFSPNYLNTLFKNHTGVTFSKYLSQVRISKAVELLEQSNNKVYEIASKVGFGDEKYFYRVFKQRFGYTPEEYRRIL